MPTRPTSAHIGCPIIARVSDRRALLRRPGRPEPRGARPVLALARSSRRSRAAGTEARRTDCCCSERGCRAPGRGGRGEWVTAGGTVLPCRRRLGRRSRHVPERFTPGDRFRTVAIIRSSETAAQSGQLAPSVAFEPTRAAPEARQTRHIRPGSGCLAGCGKGAASRRVGLLVVLIGPSLIRRFVGLGAVGAAGRWRAPAAYAGAASRAAIRMRL